MALSGEGGDGCTQASCSSVLRATQKGPLSSCFLGVQKRRVAFKGGSLHDDFGGFDGFRSSGGQLASCCLSYDVQGQETTVTVLAVLAVLAILATPLNSTPLSDIQIFLLSPCLESPLFSYLD